MGVISKNEYTYLTNLVKGGGGNAEWAKAQLKGATVETPHAASSSPSTANRSNSTSSSRSNSSSSSRSNSPSSSKSNSSSSHSSSIKSPTVISVNQPSSKQAQKSQTSVQSKKVVSNIHGDQLILSQTSHNSRSQSTSIKIGYATYSPTPKKVLSAFEQNDDYQESDRGGHHLVRDDKQIEYLNDLVENGTEGQAAWAQDQLDKRLYYYDPAGDREKMISAVDSWNDLTPSLALNIIEDPNSSDVSKVQAILYTAKNALYGLGGTARVGATGKIVEEVEGVEGMGKVDNALPNLESAKIDPRKLTEYALNPEHPVGGNKAKVFDSALGYNKSNADDLMKQIQEKLPQSEAVLGKSDQYGQRYTVDMQITGPNGNTTTVRTGWIIKPGSDAPEMTTIYVK